MISLKTAPSYSIDTNILHNKKILAIIVAGGSSTRMNGINKLFAPILGVPVIARTLIAFDKCVSISGIVISARDCDIPDIQRICSEYNITKLRAIATGGDTRTKSVSNAIAECDEDIEYFAIHDAARPLVSNEIIEKTIDAAIRFRAAAPAVQVKDTVKIANENMKIVSTPNRSFLFSAQTPQIFESNLYKSAMALGGEFTDDCMLIENAGVTVTLVEGDYSNIKITTPEDIAIAEALMIYNNKK